jgi:predicted small lipoprotein YifL
VNRVARIFSPRWGLVLAAAATLALTGCGRKGPLDLPPTGTKDQQITNTTVPPPATDTEAQRNATPSVFNPGYGVDAPPTAAKGAKKTFILDPLLNSN